MARGSGLGEAGMRPSSEAGATISLEDSAPGPGHSS